jgi:hypothetical protein
MAHSLSAHLAGAPNLVAEVRGIIDRMPLIVNEDAEAYDRIEEQIEQVRASEKLPPEEMAAVDEHFLATCRETLKRSRAFARKLEKKITAEQAA